MPTELNLRVTSTTLAAVLPLAGIAAWLGGAAAGAGLLGAGALTVANFLWLTRQVGPVGRRPRPVAAWALVAGGRAAAVAAGATALIATGWAHPLAVVAGLGVLPCALVAVGLRASRGASEER
jgi:hypothetical protein